MADSQHIVIVGGHGKIALRAIPRLREAGYSVGALIRNADHAADVEAAGASSVVLDVETAAVTELAEAFAGAEAVVFSAGAGGGNPQRTHTVDYEGAVKAVDASVQAGVRRFVMVSYARSGVDVGELSPEDSFFPYAKAKHDADEYLRHSGLEYTILGPGRLTEALGTEHIRLADARGEGSGRHLHDDEKVTSRDNVATVICHVIADGAALSQTIDFYDGKTKIDKAIPRIWPGED